MNMKSTVDVASPYKEEVSNPSLSIEQIEQEMKGKRDRIPMSIPRQKLSVAPIAGSVCYWFNDQPGRIQQALQGGYEFVTPSEVNLNSFSYGSDVTQSGNTDLGDRVSIVVGESKEGTPLRAYLMKIREEWFQEDQQLTQDRCDLVDRTIHRGMLGSDQEAVADKRARYLKAQQSSYTQSNRRP